MEKSKDKIDEKYNLITDFPLDFLDFLKKFNVEEKYFAKETWQNLPRYIRLNPNLKMNKEALCKELSLEIKEVSEIDFILNFFAIPQEKMIANTDLYRKGNLYGIDLSSACTVLALNPLQDESILDLCCAPGTKLIMIADFMKKGKITGVDISNNRMNICKNIVKKYEKNNNVNFNLQVADGTTFNNSELYDKV